MTTVIGIDPGQEGGYAVLAPDLQPYACPLPLNGKELAVNTMSFWLRHHRHALVILERQQPMPKNGSIASFKLGQMYGSLLGMLSSAGMHTELVSPKTWKDLILPGTAKDKPAAVAYCGRAFPAVTLILPRCRVAHDGMADALCIAEYGRRTFSQAPESTGPCD